MRRLFRLGFILIYRTNGESMQGGLSMHLYQLHTTTADVRPHSTQAYNDSTRESCL